MSARPVPPSLPSTQLSRRSLLLGLGASTLLVGCAPERPARTPRTATMAISAIPDQDPELLNRLYGDVAERFADATGLKVSYRPVTDYTAVVRAFELGDIHLAWMGGLTGVQARSRVPGATAIAQRDIDADFHSVFIAHDSSKLPAFSEVAGLRELRGHSLTFGSETSTSGRLMPQYFLEQAGVKTDDLRGKPGFSGSHDATIELVATGSYEVGAVNEQVWKATVEAGEVDLSKVTVLWRTPGYADYHWLARPDLDDTFGAGTLEAVTDLLFGLKETDPADAELLGLFGAGSFVPARNADYDRIERVAKDLGLLA